MLPPDSIVFYFYLFGSLTDYSSYVKLKSGLDGWPAPLSSSCVKHREVIDIHIGQPCIGDPRLNTDIVVQQVKRHISP